MAEHITGTPSILGNAPDPGTVNAPAATAAETTAENPWPLRLLSAKMKEYIDRMSPVWVEGQIVEFSQRAKSSYLTLRDTDVEMSLPVHVWSSVLDRLTTPLERGARVVVNVKADFWAKTGRLSMRANDIRPVGIGELLARIEQLRQMLAHEGLFAPEHKKPLPFLPQCVGLITGRNSDAMKDVLKNAHRRWPAVRFEVREVAVQGADAVKQVSSALAELDASPEVDVIVIARGGGSMEDLLPFSNESLIRAVAAARTPVVSAIGHEADRPLLDEVADFRASTPTDAAKHLVPDMAEELAGIAQARSSLLRAVRSQLTREQERLDAFHSRPVLADPQSMIERLVGQIAEFRQRSFRATNSGIDADARSIEHLRNQVRSLSPQKTLDRGYAVVQLADGAILRDAASVASGDRLSVKVASGSLTSIVETILDADPAPTPPHSQGETDA